MVRLRRERTVPADETVLARAPQQRLAVVLAVLFGFQLVLAVVRVVEEPSTEHRFFLVLLSVAFVCGVALAASSRQSVLSTRGDVLVWRRPFRTDVVVARAAVRAVHGDVAGRPSWSGKTVVETTGGAVTIAGVEPAPAVLVPLLQEWAGVGERLAPPGPPSRVEDASA
ncbi:hypothetical protein [Cellulomonas endophytica]|uniref:hypothetical protein n=1 Tax=Cellulomonas endophytica TaxID=2494735 RepID=UPI0010136F30|nr:hypothetical protein [Cellulomonas endophytica]